MGKRIEMGNNPIWASVLGPRSAAVAISVCLGFAGCQTTAASLANQEKQQIEQSSLVLTAQQRTSIENLFPRLLRWYEFWTLSSSDHDETYLANVGKPVPVQIYSLKSSVVIFIPTLRHQAYLYEKMADGGIGQATQVSWPGMDRAEDLSTLLKEPPLGMAKALGESSSEKDYWEGEAEIRPLPLGPTGYLPIDPEKKAFLNEITEEAELSADKFYEAGKQVTLTIPNFDAGEPEIWVLVRGGNQAGMVIGLLLHTTPKQPVLFDSVVDYDVSVDRYGIKTDDAQKIEANALRTIKYVVGGIALGNSTKDRQLAGKNSLLKGYWLPAPFPVDAKPTSARDLSQWRNVGPWAKLLYKALYDYSPERECYAYTVTLKNEYSEPISFSVRADDLFGGTSAPGGWFDRYSQYALEFMKAGRMSERVSMLMPGEERIITGNCQFKTRALTMWVGLVSFEGDTYDTDGPFAAPDSPAIKTPGTQGTRATKISSKVGQGLKH